jgi:hypothetical protein
MLDGVAPSVPWHHTLSEALFHALHRGGRISQLGFTHEQVKVFRHDYVSQHHEAMLLAHFLENVQKQIAAPLGVEPGPSLITTASDEVQIAGAVVSL